jgi:putative transposase
MAAAISPDTGRAYGVARVCDGFEVARSSFYAWRRQQECTDPPPPSRRGPKPAISDAAVLSAIRADLDRSPWIGEGIARYGHGCACSTTFELPASGCCG